MPYFFTNCETWRPSQRAVLLESFLGFVYAEIYQLTLKNMKKSWGKERYVFCQVELPGISFSWCGSRQALEDNV